MLALDRAQREIVQFLNFMSQYICLATSTGRKAGSLSMNTAQSVDRLSTNKADLYHMYYIISKYMHYVHHIKYRPLSIYIFTYFQFAETFETFENTQKRPYVYVGIYYVSSVLQ